LSDCKLQCQRLSMQESRPSLVRIFPAYIASPRPQSTGRAKSGAFGPLPASWSASAMTRAPGPTRFTVPEAGSPGPQPRRRASLFSALSREWICQLVSPWATATKNELTGTLVTAQIRVVASNKPVRPDHAGLGSDSRPYVAVWEVWSLFSLQANSVI